MIQSIIAVILMAFPVYLICGIIFTFFFIPMGLKKIDEDVPGSSWGFRIIIIPGCILLWALLLNKWLHAVKTK